MTDSKTLYLLLSSSLRKERQSLMLTNQQLRDQRNSYHHKLAQLRQLADVLQLPLPEVVTYLDRLRNVSKGVLPASPTQTGDSIR